MDKAEERARAVCTELAERGADFLGEVDAEDVIAQAIREAVEEEREACAKIASSLFVFGGHAHTYASENADLYRVQDDACARAAAAIRARGKP